jgi:hypothetical protein
MKVYLYRVCGSGQSSVRDDQDIAYMYRKDWLTEIGYRLGGNADLANLDDKQISERVSLIDDSAIVVDLIGPDKVPGSYQEITLLYRPAGGLDPATSFDGIVGAYSSPADLPQPLLKDDEITWVSLQQ